MKPLLHIEDGRIEPLARVRTKRKAVQHLLDVIAEDTKGKEEIRLSIIHAAAAEEAKTLQEEIQERFGLSDILVAELSPVVGTHAGPGTVGTAYYSAG